MGRKGGKPQAQSKPKAEPVKQEKPQPVCVGMKRFKTLWRNRPGDAPKMSLREWMRAEGEELVELFERGWYGEDMTDTEFSVSPKVIRLTAPCTG